jgi:hypothetical protein
VPTSRATRVTSDAKAVELVDHGVDGVLELEDLALHLDGDLLRQVAARHRRRHLGDVADLRGEVGRHRVHVVGQILPVPATPRTVAWPPSLPSVPTSRATRVTSEAKEASCSTIVFTTLPMRRNSPRSGRPSISTGHRLGQVALGDRADDARHLGGRLHHVLDELVHRTDRGLPPAGRVLDAPALGDLAFLADHGGETLEFVRHLLVEADHFVENGRNLAVDPGEILREPNRKVAAPKAPQRAQKLATVQGIPRVFNVH